MRRTLLLPTAIGLAVACGSPAPPPVVAVPPPVIIAVEPPREPDPVPVAVTPDAGTPSSFGNGLAEAALREWSTATQCQSFDYHPNGGIQSFWCHRPARVTVAAIAQIAGVDLFASGPHPRGDLDLDATNDFGHYNPAFVRWLVDQAGPSGRESGIREATQSAYDKNLKPLAEIFFYTLEKAKKESECFNAEKKAYADLMAKKKLPKGYYERWFYYMNPFFCAQRTRPGDLFGTFSNNGFDGGIDGNVTKTVIGFWIRRSLDGTMDTFAEGLKRLLAAYEPLILDKPYRAPDAAAIQQALAAAVTRAGTGCRPGTDATVNVSATVHTDGSISATAMRGRGASPAASCVERLFTGKVPAFDGSDMTFDRVVRPSAK